MHIRLTGSNGYIGRLLTERLQEKGHSVLGIQRNHLYGKRSILKSEIRGTDVVINLAGAPILQRWTEKNKKIIYNSRVITTRNLVQAITELPEKDRPKKVISVSAIGIYKSGQVHTEKSTNFDDGFVGKVVRDWEHELKLLPDSIQTVIFRLGVVLGKEAKTIKTMLVPFKLGLGGKIGAGDQAFPFIHEKDVVNAFVWAIEKTETSETFNLTAPENISNKLFTQALAKQLKRPAILTVPPLALKILFGKASTLLTCSPQVVSNKVKKSGFNFRYPDIETTLKEIFG